MTSDTTDAADDGSDAPAPAAGLARQLTVASALRGVGVGIAVFLLVTVAVIESLRVEFSAIVGLPVGLVAGVLAAALVALWIPGRERSWRLQTDVVAGFGYGLAALVALRFVDVGGVGSSLTLDVVVGGAGVVGLVAAVVSWYLSPDDPEP